MSRTALERLDAHTSKEVRQIVDAALASLEITREALSQDHLGKTKAYASRKLCSDIARDPAGRGKIATQHAVEILGAIAKIRYRPKGDGSEADRAIAAAHRLFLRLRSEQRTQAGSLQDVVRVSRHLPPAPVWVNPEDAETAAKALQRFIITHGGARIPLPILRNFFKDQTHAEEYLDSLIHRVRRRFPDVADSLQRVRAFVAPQVLRPSSNGLGRKGSRGSRG